LADDLPPVGRDIQALLRVIEARADTSFSWRGEKDCVSYAAFAVEAQSGVDPRGGLRWTSKRQALAVLAAEGGLEVALDARLTRVAPALARRGDVAAVLDEILGIRLMIVEGAMLVGPGKSGNERQPRGDMILAWDAMSARRDGGASHV
jgi:hypothetical protein